MSREYKEPSPEGPQINTDPHKFVRVCFQGCLNTNEATEEPTCCRSTCTWDSGRRSFLLWHVQQCSLSSNQFEVITVQEHDFRQRTTAVKPLRRRFTITWETMLLGTASPCSLHLTDCWTDFSVLRHRFHRLSCMLELEYSWTSNSSCGETGRKPRQ